MSYDFMDIARTPSVRAAQAAMGADHLWEGFRGHRASSRFGPQEQAFIAECNSFYLATVSETGWPYVQHRGGPRGFLHAVDDATLAFLDYRGNRQYISTGNLLANNRACVIIVDYRRRARLKIYGHVDTVALAADPALAERLADPAYRAVPERILRLRLDAFDWNCPQHITPRFTEPEIAEAVRPLHERIAELERENAALRERTSTPPGN